MEIFLRHTPQIHGALNFAIRPHYGEMSLALLFCRFRVFGFVRYAAVSFAFILRAFGVGFGLGCASFVRFGLMRRFWL